MNVVRIRESKIVTLAPALKRPEVNQLLGGCCALYWPKSEGLFHGTTHGPLLSQKNSCLLLGPGF